MDTKFIMSGILEQKEKELLKLNKIKIKIDEKIKMIVNEIKLLTELNKEL